MSGTEAEATRPMPLPLQFLAAWLAVWLGRILQRLVARKYDGSQQQGPGRPRKRGKIAKLLLKMARTSETWGYTRLMGALQNIGYKIGRNTIKRILLENGIDPAPIRGKRMSWAGNTPIETVMHRVGKPTRKNGPTYVRVLGNNGSLCPGDLYRVFDTV